MAKSVRLVNSFLQRPVWLCRQCRYQSSHAQLIPETQSTDVAENGSDTTLDEQKASTIWSKGAPVVYRGIAKRTGVSIALGNNLKPDPLLRSQLTIQNQNEILEATMVPLSKLPYEDQLTFKYERCKQLVRNFSRTLAKRIPGIHLDEEGLICPVDPIVPSPVLTKFRNKDELNVGVGADGFPKRVGYYVGRGRDDDVVCVSPTTIPNMKDSHKFVGKIFEEYIAQSVLDHCHVSPAGIIGHWKSVIIRSNRAGDIMVSVIMHPQDLTNEELDAEKGKLREYFQDGPGKVCNIKSMYFQACRHSFCSHLTAPYQHVFGETHIYEQVGHLKVRISPGAFFQLNVDCAEVMYTKVGEILKPDSNSILLDVCCGTGTIGLFLANKFDKVIGVEQDFMAVHDAHFNAQLNGIKNATFFCDVAEKSIPRLLANRSFNYNNVSAVLNPSRGGLTVKPINALRKAEQVDRVVYISCKPIGNAMRNLIDLCLPTTKLLPGEPFYPTRVVPVDMFPQTEHCELLFLFERNRLFFI